MVQLAAQGDTQTHEGTERLDRERPQLEGGNLKVGKHLISFCAIPIMTGSTSAEPMGTKVRRLIGSGASTFKQKKRPPFPEGVSKRDLSLGSDQKATLRVTPPWRMSD